MNLIHSRGLLLVVVMVIAPCFGCDDASPPSDVASAPTFDLPPFVSQTAELRRIANGASAEPDEKTKAYLIDLVVTSFTPSNDPPLQKKAEGALLRHEFVRFGLEYGLTHVDPTVRSNSAWQLGRLGDASAIPPLLWRWRQEVELSTRAWIIGALARLGNYSALPTLVEMLDDPEHSSMALQVADDIFASAERKPEKRTWSAIQVELNRIHNTWLHERRVGAGGSNHAALTARLASLMLGLDGFQLRPVDEARTVYLHLSFVPFNLLQIGLTAEETYLRAHTVEIVRDLGRAAEPLGSSLLPLLGDPTARLAAIEALGEVGYAAALPHLVALLRSDDLDLAVAAAQALGPLDDPAAAAPLRVVFDDPDRPLDLRVRAAFSLALFTADPAPKAFLRQLLEEDAYHAPTLRELLDRIELSDDHAG